MLVQGVGDFSPGTITPLPLNGGRLGVLVCYEGIFPELAREHVRLGADLLVNITNDAWYGRTSAPYQHLSMARFRAIENRIWLARAANTGVSAFVSPAGVISGSTPIFSTTFVNGTVGLGSSPTLYGRIGDLPAILCLALGIVWLARTRERPASRD
jgi:apolipoprotein N-acyltransferase